MCIRDSAYTHDQEDYQNPETTEYRKSLANSCLRYDFDHLECHPAEAYASGDFRIIWVENEHGEIGSRCVAYQNPEGVLNSGPIYGCTDPAIDIISNYLVDNKANTQSDASWVGAKLLRIPHKNSEQFVGPYLDLSPQSYTDDGEHLVVDSYGEISGSDHQGLLGNACYCQRCEESTDPDYMRYSEINNEEYCESCFDDLHFYCEYEGDYALTDYSTRVYSYTRGGQQWDYAGEWAIENCDSIVFSDYDEEYWELDHTTHVEDVDMYIPTHKLECDPDFIFDDEDGMWYSKVFYEELMKEREANEE